MVGLECVLHVPTTYPKEVRPSIDVKNKEMGRDYQINVERGFARLAESRPQSTLLGLTNSLTTIARSHMQQRCLLKRPTSPSPGSRSEYKTFIDTILGQDSVTSMLLISMGPSIISGVRALRIAKPDTNHGFGRFSPSSSLCLTLDTY